MFVSREGYTCKATLVVKNVKIGMHCPLGVAPCTFIWPGTSPGLDYTVWWNNLAAISPTYKRRILSILTTSSRLFHLITTYTFTCLTPLLNHNLSRLRLRLKSTSCRTGTAFVKPSATWYFVDINLICRRPCATLCLTK
jgi:hypothetical protein